MTPSQKQPIAVAPSILSADFADMAGAVKRLERANADLIHCDVMDGVFVPNISFGPQMIADIRKVTTLPLDVHLMIIKPERYIDRFMDAGADYLTFHIEATDIAKELLTAIRGRGVRPGIVISPDTPVSAIEPLVPLCDIVLVMSVHPGFGGQKYIDSATEKLSLLRELIDRSGKPVRLEVDGGITLENAHVAIDAGADTIVAGSAIFNANDMAAAVAAIRG